jgi:two-component system LytT family response regulator
MKLRTLLVDHEPLSRDRIARMLADEPDVEVVGECAGGAAAVEAIRALDPDLVLMDVQMPGMDGFEVLRQVAPRAPRTVFVTAHDRHALRAFEVHAVDFLLKPFSADRLREAIRRAARQSPGARREAEQRLEELLERLGRDQRALGRRIPAAPERPAEYPARLLVKKGERMVLVPVERVDWLEAEGNYVRLHAGTERHLVRATMNGMEKLLDPRRFLRIHRSTIVNLDRVREVKPWFAGDCIVLLEDGKELRLSRRYRDRLDRLVAG